MYHDEYGKKINVRKIKILRISKHGGCNLNIILNEEKIEQVAKFCYLGSLITDNGTCSTEIRSRIVNSNGENSFQQEERTVHQERV